MELTDKQARNILRANRVDFAMDDRPAVSIVEALGLISVESVPDNALCAILEDNNEQTRQQPV